MKSIFKTPLAFSLLTAIGFCPFSVMAAAPSTVGVKCEIDLITSQSHESQRFVRTLQLKTEREPVGTTYRFDHIETLKTAGKPDVHVWIEGHYFHNNNTKDNSFLRFSTTSCGTKLGSEKIECYGQDHSGDIFSNVVRAKTIHFGKNLMTHKNALPGADLKKSFEAQMKYRLITGRSLLKDLDTNDPVQREKYLSLVTPIVGVECSVRDDAYGVVSAF